MIGYLTAVSILVVTVLMLGCQCHLTCRRRLVRRITVNRVRASLATWLTPEQPTDGGGVPPTTATVGGCSRTAGPGVRASGPAVPARTRLELQLLQSTSGHHLGCAS